ncbi:glycerol-3-phosphate dehydrogenase/oxidase [Crenobacter caeni]|uniref:Glycerol-3-phosphate dehydrogenase/oxidase n=1 Tax=Crenobacter caeni TaxID=2705474 RepID=A0A6B2KQY6_9NEIS|nr:glycerol-3-phosphate dehydrogenase/oxidase [Crenobacter caeni]NDV12568.1 glycerol-3-phosphate dehydrogenase/oxidase [Crenobacter caeni]
MQHPRAAPLSRARLLERLATQQAWDVAVIGGGATGLGIALDSASRGFSTLLVDAQDFAAGTSSRSTKLVHGGVRYLQQGRVALVREALHERALLLRNAPYLTRRLQVVVPCYGQLERVKLRVGLGLYDALAGDASLGDTEWLSREETLRRLPGIRREGLTGGVAYWDGQFDDARLAISLMHTAHAQGALPLNYMRLESLERDSTGISRLTVRDTETGLACAVSARVVFNAAGVWADRVRRLASPDAPTLLRFSRGSHLLVDPAVLPFTSGMLIPKTPDGRVLFALPWHGRVLLGTTDVEADAPDWAPVPSAAETGWLLETASAYLERPLGHADIRATFAGLRPLYSPQGASGNDTARLSREHALVHEFGNMITVTGGKWTTYRRMAEDAVSLACARGLLPRRECVTATLPLLDATTWDTEALEAALLAGEPAASTDLAHFARHAQAFEAARTAEDVLYRRLHIGLLDAGRCMMLTACVSAALAAAHSMPNHPDGNAFASR